MLKEILKIDSSDTAEAKPVTNELSTSTCRQDSYGPASQQKHKKKIGMYSSLIPFNE